MEYRELLKGGFLTSALAFCVLGANSFCSGKMNAFYSFNNLETKF